MLSRAEARTVSTLAEALLPAVDAFPIGAAEVDMAARVGAYLAHLTPATRTQLRALLRAWEAGPLASRHLRPFSRLAPSARTAWVEQCAASRAPWRRLPLALLRMVCLAAFCTDPRVEAALGYQHGCLDDAPPRSGPRLRPLQFPAVHGNVEETADVCVIGSGAGGAVVARELARAGLRVVVLEEGAYFTQQDFVGAPFERAQRFYRNGGATIALGRPTLAIPLGKCVGGTTVVNSGTCFRTPDRVLREWEAHDGLDDADPATMAPYFDEVERALSVKPVPWEIIGRNAEVFDQGVRALGLHGEPIRRNIVGCRGCGECAFGCPSDAKQAMHLTYLPAAEAAGARLYARCRAERVTIERGRTTGVEAVLLAPDSDAVKGRLTVRAPAVVVAAGAIHTPGVLRRSGVRHPALGRNLRLHPAVAVAGFFRDEIRAWRGTLQSYFVDRLQESHGVMIEVTNPVPGVSAATLPGVGRELSAGLARFRHAAAAGLFVSDTGAGRVISLPGSREPLITYRLPPRDARALLEGIALAAEVFFAAGAESVYPGIAGLGELTHPREGARLRDGRIGGAALMPTGFHPMGTARMGRDAQRAVTDSWGAVRGTHGLYVADASLFPSCVGVNPQVSIMAFATRNARRIVAAGR
ncbi:MAG TPA: GMC family oxidoreductase [Candidatus Nitrosopolaris sp.]|nr:GMC family oxidoreductase [Candidatus Nitrosopolaris sp.]